MTAGRTPPPTRAAVESRAYLDLRAVGKKSGRANDEYRRLYALEGFLLRLAGSVSSQDFVLKGGVPLAAYQLRRPTADIDFAALNTSNDLEAIKSMIVTVADTKLPDDHNDGLWFDTCDTQPSQSATRTNTTACVLIWRPQKYDSTSMSMLVTRSGPTLRQCSFPASWVEASGCSVSDPDGVGREDRDCISAWHHEHMMARLRRPLPHHGSTPPCRWRSPSCDQPDGRLPKRRDGRPSPCAGGYPALAQTKWHAWRARQNPQDRLPADFNEVLKSVLVLTDGLFDTTSTSQTDIWSPADQAWS